MKLKLLLAVCVLFTSLQLQAQDDTPTTPPTGGGGDIPNIDPQAMLADSVNSIKAAFGITTIGGETYAGFRFQPEFHVGKMVGFGLDIPIQFNINTKKFRSEEFEGGVELVRLIRYFTFGRKKETPVYIRTGDLTGVSFGFGSLINNYSNSPSFEFRKWGLNVDFNVKGIVGVEGLYSDIKGANLLGIRPYARPLRTTGIPIVKTFELGYSFVSDKGKNADSLGYFLQEDGMKAGAIDAGITVVNNSFIKLIGYGQTSWLKRVKSARLDDSLAADGLTYEKGKGSSVGVNGKMKLTTAFMLDVRIERLWYKDYYMPQFFDAIYEIHKDAKIYSLASAKGKQGIYGNLAIILFERFRLNGALLLPDQISAESPALVQVGLEAAKLGNKVTISGNYIKGDLIDLGDAFKLDQRSLANVLLSYQLASFLYVGVDYRWTFARLEDGTIKATDYFRPFFGLSFPLGGGGKLPKADQ